MSGSVAFTHGILLYNNTDLESTCPNGFVIPDHPGDTDIEWVNGTHCAVACISPIYQRSEFDAAQSLVILISWLGFGLIMLNLSSFRVSSPKPMHFLTYYNFRLSALGALVVMVSSTMSAEKRFCRDNATAISSEDGITLCSASAVVSLYSAFGVLLCWGAQIFYIFSVIVMGRRVIDVERGKNFHLLVILGGYSGGANPIRCRILSTESCHLNNVSVSIGLPLMPIALLAAGGNIGYTKGAPICFTTYYSADDPNLDLWCFWVVGAVIAGVSTTMLIVVLVKAIHVLMFLKVKPTLRPIIPFSGSMQPVSSDVSSSAKRSDSGDGNATPVVHGSGEGVCAGSYIAPDETNGVDATSLPPIENATYDTVALEMEAVQSDKSTSRTTRLFGWLHGAVKVVPAMASKAPAGHRYQSKSSSDDDVNSQSSRDGADFTMSVAERVRVLAPPLMLSTAYLVMTVGANYGRFAFYESSEQRHNVFNRWIQCIFENYYNNYTADLEASDSVDSADYFDMDARQEFAYAVCDVEPQGTLSKAAIVWFLISMIGHPFVIGIIFMKREYVWNLMCPSDQLQGPATPSSLWLW
jgi:hypothetical protein